MLYMKISFFLLQNIYGSDLMHPHCIRNFYITNLRKILQHSIVGCTWLSQFNCDPSGGLFAPHVHVTGPTCQHYHLFIYWFCNPCSRNPMLLLISIPCKLSSTLYYMVWFSSTWYGKHAISILLKFIPY